MDKKRANLKEVIKLQTKKCRRKNILDLKDSQRTELEQLTKKIRIAAYKMNHARILGSVLKVGKMLENIRLTYLASIYDFSPL